MDMDRNIVRQQSVPWVSIGYPAASSAASSASSSTSPDRPASVMYDELDFDDDRGDEDDNAIMQNIALQ